MLTLLMLTWISSALLPLFLKQSAISPKNRRDFFLERDFVTLSSPIDEQGVSKPKKSVIFVFCAGVDVTGWCWQPGCHTDTWSIQRPGSQQQNYNWKQTRVCILRYESFCHQLPSSCPPLILFSYDASFEAKNGNVTYSPFSAETESLFLSLSNTMSHFLSQHLFVSELNIGRCRPQ